MKIHCAEAALQIVGVPQAESPVCLLRIKEAAVEALSIDMIWYQVSVDANFIQDSALSSTSMF